VTSASASRVAVKAIVEDLEVDGVQYLP